MSKFKKFIFDKKNDVEMEKVETGINMDKSALSGILIKSKSKKEEKANKSLKEKSFSEKEVDKRSSISITPSIKTSKEKELKKYNSENISGYFTFNNNKFKKIQINSEQERFDMKKYKSNKIKNNNIIKRVREFVPAKEYLDLLDEIDDDEEENIEINHKIGKDDLNKKDNCSPNNSHNSENKNLNNIEDINENEPAKKIEELKETIKIIDTKNDDNISELNNKIIDIYDIDTNLNFTDKKDKNKKMNVVLSHNNIFSNNINLEKINFFRLSEIIKENRDKKFKKECYVNFSTYSTNVLFKFGEYSCQQNNYQDCILLLRKPFLYVLNPNNSPITEEKIKFFNPDISLIHSIENDNKEINKNNYLLKNKFNLSSPLLSLNFNLLSCILLINKQDINEFQIMTLGTKMKCSFIIKEKEIFNKYIFLIQNLINNTDGSQQNKLGLSLRNDYFYKETYISPYDFEKEAKSGDLLLFRTIDTCANCQRLFTCDKYDHVGIILNKNKKIYIFESTSMGKCTPLSWNSFKQLFFNLVYYRISYRKLNYECESFEKKSDNLKNIEKECIKLSDELKGKDYYLSIPRFICCNSPEDYEYEKEWSKAQGFCCSALVAAMYLKLGIMKITKSVHSVRPGDFEQDRNRVIFEEGYSLGPEKIIEFSH